VINERGLGLESARPVRFKEFVQSEERKSSVGKLTSPDECKHYPQARTSLPKARASRFRHFEPSTNLCERSAGRYDGASPGP